MRCYRKIKISQRHYINISIEQPFERGVVGWSVAETGSEKVGFFHSVIAIKE